MRWLQKSFPLILISLTLVSSAANGASRNVRPDEHQQRADKQPDVTQQRQPEPSVPLTLYNTTQSALHDALIALHTEQEARAKDQHPDYDPTYALSVLIQFALLV